MVFRLRQLPPHADRLDTVKLLGKALAIDPSAIRIFSLARSVDPWIPGKTATLMFDDAGRVLDILESGKQPNITHSGDEWRIQVDNHRNKLVLDVNFWGLTSLYDPSSHVAE